MEFKEFDSFEQFTSSSNDVGLIVSPLEQSVVLSTKPSLSIITEQELLGIKVSQRRRRKHKYEASQDALIRNLAELKEGQPVVHLDHGVGRYQGLQTIDAAGVVTSIGPSVQTTGSDVKAMYQGDIIVGRMAMGAGTLNPAAAIELRAEA